jgi:hypothetical protein
VFVTQGRGGRELEQFEVTHFKAEDQSTRTKMPRVMEGFWRRQKIGRLMYSEDIWTKRRVNGKTICKWIMTEQDPALFVFKDL